MAESSGILRRHGLTLVFVAALVALYFTQTRPALALRTELRGHREQAEREVEALDRHARELQLWNRGLHEDELLRARALEELERSPEHRGPLLLPPSASAPDDDADRADR